MPAMIKMTINGIISGTNSTKSTIRILAIRFKMISNIMLIKCETNISNTRIESKHNVSYPNERWFDHTVHSLDVFFFQEDNFHIPFKMLQNTVLFYVIW